MTHREFIDSIMEQIRQVGWHSLAWPSQDYVAHKEDFFKWFYTYLTQEHLQIFMPLQSANYTRKEIILEILLLKFDLLTPYKEAILRLRKESLTQPDVWRPILCEDYKMLTFLWQAHHLNGDSLIDQAKEKGVFAVWWAAFFVWAEDETSDLSKTMAFIDKALSFGEKLAEPYA